MPKEVFNTLVKKWQLFNHGVPEEYDYYSPKSTWKEDYKDMIGEIMADKAEEDFDAKK